MGTPKMNPEPGAPPGGWRTLRIKRLSWLAVAKLRASRSPTPATNSQNQPHDPSAKLRMQELPGDPGLRGFRRVTGGPPFSRFGFGIRLQDKGCPLSPGAAKRSYLLPAGFSHAREQVTLIVNGDFFFRKLA
jgi:hypothetical protein